MKMHTDFNDFFSHQLNEPQQKAVVHKKGPLLVIAGAGSGKTRVITTRIINLILNETVDPRNIIALTFTNKAAGEMKERIHNFVDGIKPFIGTFHAYCLQLLRINKDLLEYPTFTILDADDQQHLLTTIIKRAGLEKRISATNLAHQISIMKNSMVDQLLPDSKLSNSLIVQLVHEYEREKKTSKCFDFDDLLLEVVKLFNKYQDFKTNHQKTIRHILVDEYQDTNVTQHELLKAMALHQNKLILDSLCAVGDEDQSIYSWRGATVANILHFQKDFPKTTVIKIEQNYRSVQPILQIANQVIAHNQNRNAKTLWSEKKAKDRVKIVQCISGYQEAEAIAHLAKQHHKSAHGSSSFAVLYRAHYQSRTIEEAFIRHSIAYTIIGGIQFYERKEIKDMLAYLRLITNPFDRIAFFRVINCPLRGLGDAFQETFHQLWDKQPFLSFMDCIQHLIENDSIAGAKKKSLEQFLVLFTQQNSYDTPRKTLEHIIEKTGYFTYLSSTFDKQEAEAKIDNVKELIRATNHFEQNGITTLEQFLQEVALMQEKTIPNNKKEHTIKLMTLHAAKGLEFNTVILAGLEDGLFPSSRSIGAQETLEEERRLFYVGITRAQERLLLTHARHRYTFGSITDQLRSRFLDEIPEHLAPEHDASYWHDAQFRAFFGDWLGIQNTSSVLTFGAAYINTPLIPIPSSKISWKKNQPVKHKKFGVGIIKNIEERDQETIFITAQFKIGIKKIKSTFLEKV